LQQEIRTSALPGLAEKVAFLSSPGAYPGCVHEVACRETHMSWVFLAGEKVYKLKKPVQFSYLDFSTLQQRAAACLAEVTLNRRLAGDVYEGVVALTRSSQGLTIGGAGESVDWLVIMRRLDEAETLERTILEGRLEAWQLHRLIAVLLAFYRRTRAVLVSADRHLARWHGSVALNRRILLDARLGLPPGLVTKIDRAQRRFLARRASALAERVHGRHIVDGHGDLRPEHIFLGDPVRIIDCLEFNQALRRVDPLDEIAFLCVECERLGAGWAAAHLKRRLGHALREGMSEALFAFYRCHRATLRARLAIAHLLEPAPRTPAKWPCLARTYLALAARDAIRLERLLK
jgi:aminoglycoside phosphotransferase family enzyme